jgi:hypothetical protein
VSAAGQSAGAASALLADRFATAADIAAREAELAWKRLQPGRVRSLTPELKAAARTGAGITRRHDQIIEEDRVSYAMAGIADTAKYALAAANAARYAARAAEASGARRAARRADREAAEATSWASQAQYAVDKFSYAPYTAMMTAAAARRAAVAARSAALAAGPLGRCSANAVGIAVLFLPRDSRARYQEEWKGDLCVLPHWRARRRYILTMLAGAARLAVILRAPVSVTRSGR